MITGLLTPSNLSKHPEFRSLKFETILFTDAASNQQSEKIYLAISARYDLNLKFVDYTL